MGKDTRSFWERLTGAVSIDDEEEEIEPRFEEPEYPVNEPVPPEGSFEEAPDEEEPEEGQLMVDVYQTSEYLIVQSMVAGVDPKDLDVSISREMITISGTRESPASMRGNDYFYQELYWGPFSRTVLLPQEIDPDGAEAAEKNGLLTIKLPRIDKDKQQHIRVKPA